MARRIINRQPAQYVLEGYAAPGDTYITFPDAGRINTAPNQYQVRPGEGMWLSMQNAGSVTGTGSVTICGRLTSPELWILASPQGSMEREVRYVLTLTKTAPPPA